MENKLVKLNARGFGYTELEKLLNDYDITDIIMTEGNYIYLYTELSYTSKKEDCKTKLTETQCNKIVSKLKEKYTLDIETENATCTTINSEHLRIIIMEKTSLGKVSIVIRKYLG